MFYSFKLRQFLVHLDGTAVLVTAGNCSTAALQLRSLLETAHTMEWLLRADTDAKVNHLYVANLRQRRHWQSLAVPGTPQAAAHPETAAHFSLDAAQIKDLTDELNRINTILTQPPFDAINAKFEPHYASRGFDEPWYKVYGVSSIRKIAEELGRLKEYQYIYSPFSGVTHGSDMWKSIEMGGQHIEMNPVREPENIAKAVNLAVTFALTVYRLILKEYRHGEEENFARKYASEWRSRFMKQYKVDLTPNVMTI